jgi:hypothetical protein
MPWRHIRGWIQLHLFLTSALHGGGRLTSHPGHWIPGEELHYPLNRTLSGRQSWSGHFGSLVTAVTQALDCPVHNPVPVLIKLY